MTENQEQVLESNSGYDSVAEIFSHNVPPNNPESNAVEKEGGENRDEINTVKITQKVLIPAPIYARLSKKYKSYQDLYRHLTSGELDLTARYCVKGGKKYYFIEVDDPHIIRNAILLMRVRKIKRKVFKKIGIKVPSNLLRAVDTISSPDSHEYENFYEFVNQEVRNELAGILPIKIVSDSDTVMVEKRIQLGEEDYQRILKIAKANDLSFGKVIIEFLKNFYLTKYNLDLEKELKHTKGERNGSMLPAD